jgi:glucokinase
MAANKLNNILAADIGGTQSRFAHFLADPLTGELVSKETKVLATSDAASFKALIQNLRDSDFKFAIEDADTTCLAVAGPVKGTYCKPPNIDWDIDLSDQKNPGLNNAMMINDFVALAYSTLSRVGKDAELILPGEADPAGAIAVVGPGTGLGKSALIPDGRGSYVVMPSEGGHAQFPASDSREFEFTEFVKEKLGVQYASIDNIMTGGGMSLLNEFLTGERLTPHELTANLTDKSAAVKWGARFLGRVARNFALDTLSTGGVFIAGGVAARTPAFVYSEEFKAEFISSEKHENLLKQIPVRLITDELAGLWGAGYKGMMELKK